MLKFSELLSRVAAFFAVILLGMASATSIAQAEDEVCRSSCFVLTSVTIQGVTAYPLAEFARTYDQNLARQIRVQDLVQTAGAITDHYRRDGYFLTRAVVAPGDHTDGSATIIVYEGYIGEVVVDGSGAAAVAPILKPLQDRRALTIGELDRRLALASNIPGITLTSRVEPILDDPAQHRLLVTAELDRFNGGIYAENRGSDTQGPWQVYVTGGANSVVTAGDRATFSALTTPGETKELTFAEWTYSAPIGGGRTVKATVSGYATDAPATSTNWLSGRSQAASIAINQSILQSRDRSLSAAAELDLRQVEQTLAQTGSSKENLSVVRASLSGWRKIEGGYLAATLQVSRGIDAFGATGTVDPHHTRGDATGVFTKVNLVMSGYRDIGRFAGVYGQVSGQWSADPLLASEEFFIGGSEIGRAYNYGELSGDSGVAGIVELRFGWDPKPAMVTFFQMYAFADAGMVSNKSPTGETRADLASAGVGARISFRSRASLKFELAKPLAGPPYTEADSASRLFVSLSKEF